MYFLCLPPSPPTFQDKKFCFGDSVGGDKYEMQMWFRVGPTCGGDSQLMGFYVLNCSGGPNVLLLTTDYIFCVTVCKRVVYV